MKTIKEAIARWFEIIVIVVSGLWAFYTFYLEKEYLPAHQPAFLTVNAQIQKVSQNKSFEIYSIKITIQNKSKVKESVIASWFNIIGGRLKIIPSLSNTEYSRNISTKLDSFYRNARYFNTKDSISQIIHWGRILDDNTWLNPDQEVANEFVTLIPRHKFDVLTLDMDAITGKGEFNVNWFVNDDGNTNARLITENKKDTLYFEELKSSKNKKLKDTIKEFDLSHTFSEHQYSLGFLDSVPTKNNK